MTGARFPYQDPAVPLDRRVEDLLSRMTLEDKAGLMFQPTAPLGSDFDAIGMFGPVSMRAILDQRITHANILQAPSGRAIAEWHNAVQREAAAAPLGIPFTVSSDPRHSFIDNPLISLIAGPFSKWPGFLGFGALDDPELTRRFADVVRREYLAVGIRVALHPQVDLATEPRWARTTGTFGASAEVAGRLGAAYTLGLQGEQLGPESVAAMAKHFPGGGPQKDGEDPHFAYGREQVYPGGRFDDHLEPFRQLLAVGVSQIMPYYGMPVGTAYEEIGFAFNKQIVSGLLRDQLGFDGIICTDWGVLSRVFWGVESLTFEQRMVKALDAGVDQFGGEFRADVLVGLVRAGRVAEARLDTSVRRLLREKFRLGLFENRFVDVEAADARIGTAAAREAGFAAQVAAQTLLVNGSDAARLPLSGQPRLYVEGAEPETFAGWAHIVESPHDADVVIVRTATPWEQRGEPGDVEALFHAGSLAFHDDELDHLRELAAMAPLIVDVSLDRPAILEPVVRIASTIIVNFGACDEAFVQVLFGAGEPRGRLPFDIPSSMAQVEASLPDVPGDTPDPTFRMGDGLRFEGWAPATRPDPASTAIKRAARTSRYDLTTTPFKALLDDPESRAILDDLVPDLSSHPMIALAAGMPVEAVLSIAGGRLPAELVSTLRARLNALQPWVAAE